VQAIKDPETAASIRKMVQAKTPLLLTRQLVEKLPGDITAAGENVEILEIPADAWGLMDLPRKRLGSIRAKMLKPLGVEFDAPARVALYLFGEDLAVVENFNDSRIEARVALRAGLRPALALSLPGESAKLKDVEGAAGLEIGPRALAVVRFGR